MLKRYSEWRDSQNIIFLTILSCLELLFCLFALMSLIVCVVFLLSPPFILWGIEVGIAALVVYVFLIAGAGLARDRKDAWHRETARRCG